MEPHAAGGGEGGEGGRRLCATSVRLPDRRLRATSVRFLTAASTSPSPCLARGRKAFCACSFLILVRWCAAKLGRVRDLGSLVPSSFQSGHCQRVRPTRFEDFEGFRLMLIVVSVCELGGF
ncbi:hypothetical protein GUJ93_ZPchr0004g39649 [Zizania palustris]|uniref:Uncharacterized protein n=1 Tax=Zizania palustris TaxID=103762 RepID=A0A8J5VZN5_ZIZPA|nr:hypothetical protein GUJ93_ZPchr0004g39649 [Zizania palustris]